MRKALIALGLALVLVSGVLAPVQGGGAHAAPASRVVQAPAQTHAAFLEKTRFLAHMGAAFYAFHHFVWARYQNGQFGYGVRGRAGNFVKAAIALVFAYHELSVSYKIADKSHSKLLHALISPLKPLLASVNDESAKLKKGQYSPSDMQSVNNQVNTVSRASNLNGYSIQDIPVPVAGAS
jgi:hypothetical protein